MRVVSHWRGARSRTPQVTRPRARDDDEKIAVDSGAFQRVLRSKLIRPGGPRARCGGRRRGRRHPRRVARSSSPAASAWPAAAPRWAARLCSARPRCYSAGAWRAVQGCARTPSWCATKGRACPQSRGAAKGRARAQPWREAQDRRRPQSRRGAGGTATQVGASGARAAVFAVGPSIAPNGLVAPCAARFAWGCSGRLVDHLSRVVPIPFLPILPAVVACLPARRREGLTKSG